MKFKDLDGGQKKRLLISFFFYVLIGIVILAYFGNELQRERTHARDSWNSYLSDPPGQAILLQDISANAVRVKTGTYVENLREINLKSSYFRVEFQVWFNWEGDESLDMANNFRIYKGIINNKFIVKEFHENGKNYQLVNVDATISKNFDAKRFPLESHQMRIYLESNYPAQEVVLAADHDNSGINRNIEVAGYKFLRHDIGDVSYRYSSSHGDPALTDNAVTSEVVTAFEINRSGFGLYFKCFIALVGTLTWSLIALFICTYHHVDPLGMLPGALFGTVGNIMIGANLLPDALEMGLLEYVNLWGIITILAVSIAIININRIRNKQQDNGFAKYYGRIMFVTVLVFAIGGQLILPLMAYIS